jgi:hypothetical protein
MLWSGIKIIPQHDLPRVSALREASYLSQALRNG